MIYMLTATEHSKGVLVVVVIIIIIIIIIIIPSYVEGGAHEMWKATLWSCAVQSETRTSTAPSGRCNKGPSEEKMQAYM